jgi:hypothetical protein
VALLQGYTLGIPRGIRRGEGGFDQFAWPVNGARLQRAQGQNCANSIRKLTVNGKMPGLKARLMGAQQNAEETGWMAKCHCIGQHTCYWVTSVGRRRITAAGHHS